MMVRGWACSGVWVYMQAFLACMLASSFDRLVWVFCTLVSFSLHVIAACVTVPYRLAFSLILGHYMMGLVHCMKELVHYMLGIEELHIHQIPPSQELGRMRIH